MGHNFEKDGKTSRGSAIGRLLQWPTHSRTDSGQEIKEPNETVMK